MAKPSAQEFSDRLGVGPTDPRHSETSLMWCDQGALSMPTRLRGAARER